MALWPKPAIGEKRRWVWPLHCSALTQIDGYYCVLGPVAHSKHSDGRAANDSPSSSWAFLHLPASTYMPPSLSMNPSTHRHLHTLKAECKWQGYSCRSLVIVLLYYLVYEVNANVFIRGLQRDALSAVCVCVGGVNQRSLDIANNVL